MSSADGAAGADGPAGGRRLLLVHAHPDDESIYTGATMARYAAEGARVTLVTCTLGELGEVIPPSLADLADGDGTRLGEYRIGELAAACAALGVTDHRFLGGPGRWRDSGMMGTEGNDDPRCFWRADVDQAAGALLEVIRDVRPQVLVTYDADGAYGHPDHIQAHRVAWRAFELASKPDGPARFYATAALAAAAAPDAAAAPNAAAAPDAPDSPDAGRVTAEIDGTAYFGRKLAAMRAHATQITVSAPFFALSDGVRRRASATEYYTLLAGPQGPAEPEADLFADLGSPAEPRGTGTQAQ
jgi:N-acetyl-1-D-myo-inositol-2-amino-2-deoxy-alpha-D-glucopyranoside deacetylase